MSGECNRVLTIFSPYQYQKPNQTLTMSTKDTTHTPHTIGQLSHNEIANKTTKIRIAGTSSHCVHTVQIKVPRSSHYNKTVERPNPENTLN